MYEKINKISTQAVKKATGRGWAEWIDLLDRWGAKSKPHDVIAQMLIDKGFINNEWWAQMVAAGYEYARKKRETTKRKKI